MYGNLDDLNIRLSGPEFEPYRDRFWPYADEAQRRSYWKQLGEIARDVKLSELGRGLDAEGEDLLPVLPTSRPDFAAGPPLSPHDEASRTQRLLAMTATDSSATLYWRAGWKTILGYHAIRRGPRALPVRNIFGISPAGVRRIKAQARAWWRGATRFGIFLPYRMSPYAGVRQVRPVATELTAGPAEEP